MPRLFMQPLAKGHLIISGEGRFVKGAQVRELPVLSVGVIRHIGLVYFLQMSTLRLRFGERIRELRALKGLTQEELAEAVGVSTDFISLIERGQRAPSFENLERLAEALGVKVAGLFDFQESGQD